MYYFWILVCVQVSAAIGLFGACLMRLLNKSQNRLLVVLTGNILTMAVTMMFMTAPWYVRADLNHTDCENTTITHLSNGDVSLQCEE